MPKHQTLELTNRERAAIYFGLSHGLTQMQTFAIVDENSTRGGASAWFNTDRVQTYARIVKSELRDIQRLRDEEEARQKEAARRRRKNPDGTQDPGDQILTEIDFTDREQFIQYLNEKANELKDDKLRNDVLKMLSDHLDFKDSSSPDSVQRFYLPLRCRDCELYRNATGGNDDTL